MEKKPKTITITQYDYIIRSGNDEELDIHGHPNQFNEFDQEGHPLKEIKYSRSGEFEEMIEFGYDQHGNLTRESYYPEEGQLAEEKSFVRDDAGKITHALKKYQDGSIDTINYEYNPDGQLTRRTTTSEEGEVEQVETFEWDNGEITGHEIFDEEGELLTGPDESMIRPNETRVTQNEKGQVIREEEMDETGEVFMTIHRRYDDNGRADEVEVHFDGRGRAMSRHYFLKYEYTFFD